MSENEAEMVAHGTDVSDDNVSDPTPGAPGADVDIPSDRPPAAPLAGSRGAETVDHDTGEIVPAGESGIVFADTIDDIGIELFMRDMNATTDDSPEAVQLEIARRILNAGSIDAMWQATKVVPAKELLNTPLTVHTVRWIKSAHEGGAPKFAIVDAENGYTKAPVTFSCGALNVVCGLYVLQKYDGLPARVKITSKPSSSGQGRSVYLLEPMAD